MLCRGVVIKYCMYGTGSNTLFIGNTRKVNRVYVITCLFITWLV